MTSDSQLDRRGFLGQATGAAAALAARKALASQDAERPKTRVAIIGCGSVSGSYLPHLAKCPHAEVVSVCDILPERAKARAEEFHVPHHFPRVEKLLAGPEFDLLVNLTDMQEHEHLNREALAADKHVWSEKPIANSLAAGQELLAAARAKNLRLWGAPTVVNSPQFRFMAQAIADGKLGRVAAAHADYGHLGPDWSAFFYQRGGGCLPDLGVYNLTTLTGLLGPAESVVAMTGILTPTRTVQKEGRVEVTAEDNAMVTLDHGNGAFSHTQCGFNYFNPHGHDGSQEQRHTITIVGTKGCLGLVGYDWGPLGVDLATSDAPSFQRHVADAGDYVWQQGASLAAECLRTGRELPIKPEHALHVVEIMSAARESQETGRRVALTSTFPWPVA